LKLFDDSPTQQQLTKLDKLIDTYDESLIVEILEHYANEGEQYRDGLVTRISNAAKNWNRQERNQSLEEALEWHREAALYKYETFQGNDEEG